MCVLCVCVCVCARVCVRGSMFALIIPNSFSDPPSKMNAPFITSFISRLSSV